MIDIVNLSKSFNKKDGSVLTVLDNISCHINPGEVVSIIGPSGTGKSTFLRCINRLDIPTSGHIFFDGVDICDSKTNINHIRQKMGIVFQNFNLFSHLSILDNVIFGPIHLLKMSRPEAEKRAFDLLNLVGLADKAYEFPSSLSGGQKQRVAIARALSMRPRCILFDEPTSALDPTMVTEVLIVMKRLAAMGMTMLVVTHEMKFARDVSSRILFLSDGKICEDGTPQQIFCNPKNPKTLAFVKKLFSLHYEFDSYKTDKMSVLSEIEIFCIKHGVATSLDALFHVVDELLLNILSSYVNIVFDLVYGEVDNSLIIKVLVRNQKSNLLDTFDRLSLKIIRAYSKDFRESLIDDGLLFEVIFN